MWYSLLSVVYCLLQYFFQPVLIFTTVDVSFMSTIYVSFLTIAPAIPAQGTVILLKGDWFYPDSGYLLIFFLPPTGQIKITTWHWRVLAFPDCNQRLNMWYYLINLSIVPRLSYFKDLNVGMLGLRSEAIPALCCFCP